MPSGLSHLQSVASHLAPPIALALENLEPQHAAAAHRTFNVAHESTLAVLRGAAPDSLPAFSREAALAKAALDPVAAKELADALAGLAIPCVDPSGNIYGFGKYEQLDPGWLECVLAWLYYPLFDRVQPFPTPPSTTITAPNTMDIALLGDWGGGPHSAAPVVLDQVRLLSPQPQYTIHLGDVYYWGAPSTGLGGLLGRHAEMRYFVNVWLPGTAGSFALNSNHEMYAGGQGYFKDALTAPAFAQQKGASYFALENDDFVIVGLDTAYYCNWGDMYQLGSLRPRGLDPSQLSTQQLYLQAQAAKGKKIVLLTHHTGLSDNGVDELALWQEVVDALPSGATCYWYWGHNHQAAVYSTRVAGGKTIYPRCEGHGAIPFGNGTGLQAQLGKAVLWYENTSRDPGGPDAIYMVNGFAKLSFDGANLTETFIDQNGGEHIV